MKTVKNVLIGMLLLFAQFSHGQISFSHAIGGSYYFASLTEAPGIMYSPRINLFELSDELTISVGTHLGLGLVSANSREGARSFAFDLPIVAEVNFGHGANRDTKSLIGGFAGLGYGISKIGSAGTFGADSNDARGLILNGGVRVIIQERSIGLRLSYLLNTKEGYENVTGVGLFWTFGRY